MQKSFKRLKHEDNKAVIIQFYDIDLLLGR